MINNNNNKQIIINNNNMNNQMKINKHKLNISEEEAFIKFLFID